jgi:hypothetical protein
VANLLGNMCRHSGYFYPALERHGILPPLIERCSDPDKGARWVFRRGTLGKAYDIVVATTQNIYAPCSSYGGCYSEGLLLVAALGLASSASLLTSAASCAAVVSVLNQLL